MSRYIDIDGYRKLFDGEYKETKKLIEQGETHLDNLAEGFHEASQVIDRIPTADVAEVRHGKWVNKGDYAVCTECGERSGTQYDGVEPIPLMTKFCSNCGAKMDESGTDTNVGSRKE